MNQFNHLEKQESLEILNYQIRICDRCNLSITRQHALTGEGNIDAHIMFVALSPGAIENSQNRMFVGPSGQVFNKLLRIAEFNRKSVFITNLVKCMLSNNRKPKMDEIEARSQFLDEEISTIQPEIIVPLGSYATNAILKKYDIDPESSGMSFTNMNGKFMSFYNKKVFPLTYPTVLLYNPSFELDTINKYKELNKNHKMKLEHIALSVSDHKEIEKFYINVLGMKQIKNFVLRKELAANIFGINKEIIVSLMQKDSVVFEIFITTEYKKEAFDHVCISIKNREEFINKAMQNGYKVIRIEREIIDLIFIKDKDGNIFEIKKM